MEVVQITISVKRGATVAERQLLGRAVQWMIRLPPRGMRLSLDSPQAVERLLAGALVPFVFLVADIGPLADSSALSSAFTPLGALVDNIRLNGRSWHAEEVTSGRR